MLRFALGCLLTLVGLAAQGRITGTVVDATRDPAPAVDVWAELDGKVVARSKTDGSGMYVLGSVPFGRVRVWAQRPGSNRGMESCTTSAARPFAYADLRVHDAGTVRGVVRGPDDKPIAGAFVQTENDVSFDWYIPEFRCDGRTDEHGRFEIGEVILGPTTLRVWCPGHQLFEQRMHLASEHACDVRLVAAHGASLRIRLDQATPEQIATGELDVHFARAGSGTGATAGLGKPTLGSDGSVLLQGLPMDLYPSSVFLKVAGARLEPGVVRFDKAPGEDQLVREAAFRIVDSAALEVRGRLQDEAGRPLAARVLTLSRSWPLPGATTRTDANGAFALRTPTAERRSAVLRLEHADLMIDGAGRGYLGGHGFEIDPEQPLELTAVRARALSVRLVDRDGRAIAGAVARLLPDGQRYGGFRARAAGDGRVRFGRLNLGDERPFVVDVQGRWGTARSEPFRFADVAGQDLGELVVEPAAALRGVVSGPDGKPLPGARVMVRRCEPGSGKQIDGFRIETIADRRGRFAFVGLTAQGWRLGVHAIGVDEAPVMGPWFDLKPGEVRPVRLVAADGRR